jgi:small subunit ribosomal protein S16
VAVKIRLLRVGKTKQPSYRIVVADGRSPRDGRIIETIGHYGPRAEPSRVELDGDRALAWLRNGAQPTEQVQKLLAVTGVWGTFEAEKKGPIDTKLNRRGFVTGRGPKPTAKAQSAPEPQPAPAAEPEAEPATAEAEPEPPAAAAEPEPEAPAAAAEPEPAADAAAEPASEEPSA